MSLSSLSTVYVIFEMSAEYGFPQKFFWSLMNLRESFWDGKVYALYIRNHLHLHLCANEQTLTIVLKYMFKWNTQNLFSFHQTI